MVMKNNSLKYKHFTKLNSISLFFLILFCSINIPGNLKAQGTCGQLTLQYKPDTSGTVSFSYTKCDGTRATFVHHEDSPATVGVQVGSKVCLGIYGLSRCFKGGAKEEGFFMPAEPWTITCWNPVTNVMTCGLIPDFVPDNACQCKDPGKQSVCYERNPGGEHRCDPGKGHCECTFGRKCSPAGWCQD